MNRYPAYQKFARYYDAYVAGFQEDLPVYQGLCPPGASVLEIGCGTGRVLAAFLKRGHSVTGVDISREMLAIAATKLDGFIRDGRLRLINHNFSAAPFPETFRLVLVTFYTFNYLLGEDEALAFLANVRRSMAEKALLIIDLFYPLGLSHPDKNGRWIEKSFPMAERVIRLCDQRVLRGDLEERTQRYGEPDGTETEIVTVRRYYSKHEMLRLLQETGYHPIQFCDGYRPDTFHSLKDDETSVAGFCVLAKNGV